MRQTLIEFLGEVCDLLCLSTRYARAGQCGGADIIGGALLGVLFLGEPMT